MHGGWVSVGSYHNYQAHQMIIHQNIMDPEWCGDPIACNYNEEATDEGICEYATEHYDCLGNCLVDTDYDGICDIFEIPGCTIWYADNYNAAATDDDGSCIVPGCM